MMFYSSKFFERVNFLKRELTTPVVVGAGMPGTREFVLGNMIRSGFGITLFVALEDHINTSARDTIRELTTSRLNYQDFSTSLRKILIVNALSGVENQIKLNKNWNDQQILSYAETEILRMSKFNTNPREHSGAGFNYKGSNLYADDISGFTKSLASDANWPYLGSIVQALGGSRPDLKTDFDELASMRHSAAHKAEPLLDISTLQLHLDAATAIAIGFSLAAFYLSFLMKSASSKESVNASRTDYMRYTRFVTPVPSRGFGEVGPSGRIVKLHPNARSAVLQALSRGLVQIAVLKDDRGLPIDIFFRGRSY
ncbi:hypothetical protein HRR99_22145 [Agrobacterium vaccinii]|uniref:hypothetical protein n=1 Tax=Agrobacterium vaccinii TaxID=2735528 RepID=UPI001E47F8AE|nr:hypothetical protein [Agrobacterium vaccinii]UHS64211.1 hypothetical protein HRR99_22145 [Agrobacterium vaccinii]